MYVALHSKKEYPGSKKFHGIMSMIDDNAVTASTTFGTRIYIFGISPFGTTPYKCYFHLWYT